MRPNFRPTAWHVRGLVRSLVPGLLAALLGGCASAPRLPADHPARSDGPSAPLAEVGRSLHEDPVPLAPLSGAEDPHASHGSHGVGR